MRAYRSAELQLRNVLLSQIIILLFRSERSWSSALRGLLGQPRSQFALDNCILVVYTFDRWVDLSPKLEIEGLQNAYIDESQ